MDHAAPTMKAWLTKANKYQDAFASFGNATPPDPRWQQSWFPRLDGMMAYVLTREFRPERIIEIGSGHSTRFYYRAILDGELDTIFHAIDPVPRADIAALPITNHLAKGRSGCVQDIVGCGYSFDRFKPYPDARHGC